jgi:hypothetical protein
MRDAMQSRRPLPVYLPDNEPYLGREILLSFDRAIPDFPGLLMKFSKLEFYRSESVESEEDLREIQELLRHRNIRTTVRYTHVGYEQTRQTAEALSRALE